MFMYFSWKLQYFYGKYRESWNLRDGYVYWYYRIYSLQWNKHSLLDVLLSLYRWLRSLCSNQSQSPVQCGNTCRRADDINCRVVTYDILCFAILSSALKKSPAVTLALKSDLCLGVEHIIITLQSCCGRNTLDVY